MTKFAYFLIPTVTLLEGIAYLGLSIWGLAMRTCSQGTADILSKPFQFTMDLIYLQDQDCGNPSVDVLGVSKPVALDINWNESEPIKTRTLVFLLLYLVLSVLWIIFSLLMLSKAARKPKRWIVILWFKFVWILSIIDVVATGFHGYDISHTASASATFDYLGITTNEATLKYLTTFDVQFTAPAIIMTIISSRAVILWLFNVFGSFYCLSLIRKTLPERLNASTAIIPVTIVVEKEPQNNEVFINS